MGGGVEVFRCSICDVGMVLCCMSECVGGGVLRCFGAVFVWLYGSVLYVCVCVWGGGVLRCLGAVFVMLVWFCAVCLSVGGGVEVFRCSICDGCMVLCCISECGGGC